MSRNVLPEIQRIPGVGQAQLFGTERAMRVWIDPDKAAALSLTASDIINAIREQNLEVSAGTIGGPPRRHRRGRCREQRPQACAQRAEALLAFRVPPHAVERGEQIQRIHDFAFVRAQPDFELIQRDDPCGWVGEVQLLPQTAERQIRGCAYL